MLFLNISLPQIILEINWETKIIENKKTEETIPKILFEYFEKYNFKNITIINWPWSFTALRIWSLSINILNFLKNYNLNLFSIDKITLYKYLFEKNFLPWKWIIYIWQKKKALLYDFENDFSENIFIDNLEQKNLFTDFWLNSKNINILKINLQNQKLNINFENNNILVSPKEITKPEKTIQPNYLIQPNISYPSN